MKQEHQVESPLVSVITVVYNAKEALELTLQSIEKQTYINKQSIIIDGGSKDGTLEVIQKYQHIISYWVSEPDKGIYDAMNKGLRTANADYVTFLNAGDHYCSDNVLSSLFEGKKHPDVVYGDINIVKNNSDKPKYLPALDFTKHELLAHGTRVVCHQAFFVRRALAPIYNPRYKYKSELNWYFDILEQNQSLSFIHHDLAVVNYDLSGYGFINYKSNLFEWCLLVIRRFGFRTFFKYNYPKIIYSKLKFRYPDFFSKYLFQK